MCQIFFLFKAEWYYFLCERKNICIHGQQGCSTECEYTHLCTWGRGAALGVSALICAHEARVQWWVWVHSSGHIRQGWGSGCECTHLCTWDRSTVLGVSVLICAHEAGVRLWMWVHSSGHMRQGCSAGCECTHLCIWDRGAALGMRALICAHEAAEEDGRCLALSICLFLWDRISY